MKKLIIVLIVLLLAISVKADELEWRTGLHFAGGFFVYSDIYIAASAVLYAFNDNSIETRETVSFYVTGTGLVVYEYWSNDWEGFKFWDLTGSVFGMVAAREIWKGTKPVVYPNICDEKVGLGFSFQF